MQCRALATDYDGTLATHGSVDEPTIEALRRFRESRGLLIMVTGRQLHELGSVFPHLDLFVRVVAENGALVYDPGRNREVLLCEPASQDFVSALRRRHVPVSVGRAIVATTSEYHKAVEQTIQETKLSLNVILNKGSLMVLPSGIDKTTGLHSALAELGISAEAVVGIGDAENDIDFLAECGCGIAVANALPSVKSRANLVTRGAHGAGVTEVIDHLLRDGQLPCHRGRVSQFLVPD